MIFRRIEELDVLKGVAIICVVIGHVHLFAPPQGDPEDWTYKVIYSFHMPLFMTISGLLSAKLFERPAVSTIVSKIRRIVIPCLVWQVVTCLLIYSFDKTAIISEYWYLKCLFSCICLTVVVSRVFKPWVHCILVCMLITWLIPTVWNIPYMYPFFCLGVAVGRMNWLTLLNKHTTDCIVICSVLEVILLRFWHGSMSQDFSRLELLIYNSNYWYDLYVFVYRFVIATNSCVLLYCLSRKLLSCFSLRPFKEVGKQSLGIYLIHSIILNKLLGIHLDMPKPLTVALVSLVVIGGSFLICKVVSLNKYTARYMLGE